MTSSANDERALPSAPAPVVELATARQLDSQDEAVARQTAERLFYFVYGPSSGRTDAAASEIFAAVQHLELTRLREVQAAYDAERAEAEADTAEAEAITA